MRAFCSLVWLELLWYRGYPLRLVGLAISPGLMVAPFLLFSRLYGPDPSFQTSVAIGLILWLWLSTLIWDVGYGLENDLEAGTLESLLIAPTSIIVILAAKSAVCILSNLFVTASIIGWLFVFHISIQFSWPLLIALALLNGFALSGFVIVLASSVLLLKKSENIGVILQTILGVLSGVTAPPHLFPKWVQVVARMLPLTYGIAAARLLLQGQPLGNQVLWLTITGIFYALIGRAFIKLAERRMKLAGTTGEF